MTVEIPEYVEAQGHIKVMWLPAAADLAAITLTEFAAGVDATCYFPDAWGGITGEQAKGTVTRMCTRETLEAFGKVTRSISAFTATYLPQGDPDDPGNELRTAMAEGSSGVLAVRFGPQAALPMAAAQKYKAIRAEAGVQNDNTAAQDEFAPLTYTQEISARGTYTEGVVPAA